MSADLPAPQGKPIRLDDIVPVPEDPRPDPTGHIPSRPHGTS